MCTLRHAFDASNLLGLVWKIVQESYTPISEMYSVELRTLIDKMLHKESSKRPTIDQILSESWLQPRINSIVRERLNPINSIKLQRKQSNTMLSGEKDRDKSSPKEHFNNKHNSYSTSNNNSNNSSTQSTARSSIPETPTNNSVININNNNSNSNSNNTPRVILDSLPTSIQQQYDTSPLSSRTHSNYNSNNININNQQQSALRKINSSNAIHKISSREKLQSITKQVLNDTKNNDTSCSSSTPPSNSRYNNSMSSSKNNINTVIPTPLRVDSASHNDQHITLHKYNDDSKEYAYDYDEFDSDVEQFMQSQNTSFNNNHSNSNSFSSRNNNNQISPHTRNNASSMQQHSIQPLQQTITPTTRYPIVTQFSNNMIQQQSQPPTFNLLQTIATTDRGSSQQSHITISPKSMHSVNNNSSNLSNSGLRQLTVAEISEMFQHVLQTQQQQQQQYSNNTAQSSPRVNVTSSISYAEKLSPTSANVMMKVQQIAVLESMLQKAQQTTQHIT